MCKAADNDLDYLIGRYGDAQKALMIAILKIDDKQKAAVEKFIDELISLRNL
jgi:hypothetical protein